MSDYRRRLSGRLVFGLVLAGAGILLTLGNLGLVDRHLVGELWPLALVLFGILRVAFGETGGQRTFGGVLAIAGTWLLLNRFDLLPFRFRDFWPVLLVVLGGFMVVRALRGDRLASVRASSDDLNAFIVLGGMERRCTSSQFRGGELTAIMGGCEVDLSDAQPAGEQTVLEVLAIMGGIELKVPQDWQVVSEVTPVLGGFEDGTKPPVGVPKTRLVIRGTAAMGGIEVKN